MEQMEHSIKMRGTCATELKFTIKDGIMHNVRFVGGCDGNLKAVMRLVEGRPADEVASILSGIRCGRKSTSCPDQLAKAIERVRAEADMAAAGVAAAGIAAAE